MARITNKYLAARVARLNNIAGTAFTMETGSRYTCWKLCKDNTQSRNILTANTMREFDAAITGMIEMAWILRNAE